MNSIGAVTQSAGRKRNRGAAFTYARLRIDMTPMVDLGFLLITFFIYTSAMSDPATMDLFMPKDGPPAPIAASGSFTILIGNNGAVACYENQLEPDGSNLRPLTRGALRAALIQKKKEVIARYTPDPACEAKARSEKRPVTDCWQGKLMVMIKPGKEADYKTVVNVLDEMTINKIARYALVAPDATDLKYLP